MAFVGEIRLVPFNFAPIGWAFCQGQLMSISQNTALFSILGTTYGGDGKTNFVLPDFRGRVPLHQGFGPGLTGRTLGETGGQRSIALRSTELPVHTHKINYGTSSSKKQEPTNALWTTTGIRRNGNAYADATNLVPMSYNAIAPTGENQPHNNMQPYLTLSYIICLSGEFPPRN